MSATGQFELFGEGTPEAVEERERAEAVVARFREDVKTDYREPGKVLTVTLAWEPASGRTQAIRCGRCGEVILPFGFDHDTGWCGCPSDGRGQLSAEQLLERDDAAYFPACARCGCPWGLHRTLNVGNALAAECACYSWCGCQGYVPPPMAESPWGTCPGCWREPHKGACKVERRGL